MKKLFFPIALAGIMALSAFTAINSTNWKIADGYSIQFTGKDPSGVFKSLTGDILFDENDLQSSRFNVSVDVNSINTGNGMKNHKAKGDKFFDSEKYPVIKFTSSKILKTANGYAAVGILDMHGVQKEINIPFTFVNNTFKGSFSVNRLDYNVGTDQGMSGHASSVLQIDLSVPVTK